ncbi:MULTISPECIES: DUF3347 domain-containing protein [Niastella]|uniref:DUF3347 domain-containing protein n=1 Tax=Niastella soli TaxID=2821487 RepID=A0ABS3YYC1_9BACT|nr:DUF3347 domain-containing protein [Niastella soli]MBO9202924.1 DUF3347 domain-containing protein [Niastella soli]
MKYFLITLISYALLSSFVSPHFGTPGKVTGSYLLLKDRLIVSDSMAASGHALTLSQELEKMKLSKKQFKPTDTIEKVQAAAVQLAKAISATHNINKQRAYFAELSTRVWVLLEKEKKPAYPLYKQVCPMTGVSWISKDSAIKNPYYPKNMLTCGKVTAVIGATN